MNKALETAIFKMNKYGENQTPFFFIFDFEMQKPEVVKLSDCESEGIYFDFENSKNRFSYSDKKFESVTFKYCNPDVYSTAFGLVMSNLNYGYSYLTNLTMRTEIEGLTNLEEVYHYSLAKFRLLYKNQFVVFSPEPFIQISDNKIFTFPIKSTIDTSKTFF